jgi:two-component system LytT family response regulator
MSNWRVLIVDDEALARSNLQLALADHPGWQCVAACPSVADARAVMAEQPVDLLLLDIQMPLHNGLNFAHELCGQPDPPLVVFVTAYDAHAISAFEVFAIDFLLKPFDDHRFAKMLQHAEQALQVKHDAARVEAMEGFLREQRARAAGEPAPTLDFLVIRSVGMVERVAIADIEWIGAAGNYVELHTGAKVSLHRSTMSTIEERLPPGQFMRVHRTILIRSNALVALAVTGDSTYEARLRSGDTVPVSERFVKDVRALFE